MKNDRSEIYWNPRVKLQKIQELYLNDAAGIYDNELIDEIGVTLYLRCESVLEFTEALFGRVKCKRCANSGKTTILERKTQKPNELLKCPVCAWQILWRVYLTESEKTRGQLNAGHALAAFQEYVRVYPKDSNAREKILAIDRLIHEFHWVLGRDGKTPLASRTACVNLLEGTATEVLNVLDGLAGGTTSGVSAEKDAWRR
jgi:hypothetical protein